MSTAPQIQAALFGVVCREPETRSGKNGKPFVQFFVRVGETEDEPVTICVRASRPETISRAAHLVGGVLICVEGPLFINQRAAGPVFDMVARHLQIIGDRSAKNCFRAPAPKASHGATSAEGAP